MILVNRVMKKGSFVIQISVDEIKKKSTAESP